MTEPDEPLLVQFIHPAGQDIPAELATDAGWPVPPGATSLRLAWAAHSATERFERTMRDLATTMPDADAKTRAQAAKALLTSQDSATVDASAPGGGCTVELIQTAEPPEPPPHATIEQLPGIGDKAVWFEWSGDERTTDDALSEAEAEIAAEAVAQAWHNPDVGE